MVTSQCKTGSVSNSYQAGKFLIEKGAVLATDMTRETILAKLNYLLNKNFSVEKIKLLMMINLKGELTEQ